MAAIAVLATCALDQWACDFQGNFERILESCRQGAPSPPPQPTFGGPPPQQKLTALNDCEQLEKKGRGPELEITGYGCEDHFLEMDTAAHALEVLQQLLKAGATTDLLCDFGLPVIHKNVRYNCRALCLNGRLLALRPKQALADDGNYRESRWFTRWAKPFEYEMHTFQDWPGQEPVPFGDIYLQLLDSSVGVESCEELFTPDSPNIRLGLAGVEVIGNGSGSHHQLRKLNTRVDLIRGATAKSGGVYLYSNQNGCDGGRLLFDGCALVAVNGDVVAQGQQFSVSDVEVVVATVDLDAVRAFRCFSASRGVQAAQSRILPSVKVAWTLCQPSGAPDRLVNRSIPVRYHSPEEEIAMGPAVWMYDYLRRSGASGFFLPLSGGADSASTAAIVFSMCRMLGQAIRDGDALVKKDVARIIGLPPGAEPPNDPHVLVNAILHTAYLGTSNSSARTTQFAAQLAKQTGHYHIFADIDPVIAAIISLFERVTGRRPEYKVHGGHYAENQALQNIQARFRMVFSYMLAQLLPWVRRGPNAGYLLVLGSANVDEGLRGYLTKYDCSSADINPIGGVSKTDLKRFLRWGSTLEGLNLPVLKGILEQPPTAELEPITETHTQTDEEDMGCTYEELSWFGRLRKIELMGPVSMFSRLLQAWPHYSPHQVADKVKFLFRQYSINRHKMTTITPSYHCESYSPDDNRFDLRPFLYRTSWEYQFARIDKRLSERAKM